MRELLRRGLRSAFTWDRVFCRAIAAWCSFAMLTLLKNGDAFQSLSFAQQISFLQIGGMTLLFFVLYTAVAMLGGVYHTDSWILLITASVCVWMWLQWYEHTSNSFLFLLAVILVYTLFVIAVVRLNADLLAAWKPRRGTVWLIATLGAVTAGAVIAVITCLRYKTFSAPNFDFGLFCNMFYNMKESGIPMVTSERDQLLSHFAVHISPIYYLFLPFYWLFPYPETLQIGQAAVLAAGVIPVILLARHHKLSGKATILISLLYAFYPALSGGCFYDLHENCFLPFFLLWTFYFFEKKRYFPMYIAAAFVLLIKEDAAIYLLFFALFVLLSERNYLHGGLLSLLAVGYFILAGYLLETYGTGMMVNRFNNLIFDREDGLLGAIKTALVNPGFLLTQLFTTGKNTWEKLVYALQLFLPLGFLPFCSKKTARWLLLAPVLVNLLTYYQYQYDIGFQYHFGITAFLIYASIKNLADMRAETRKNLLVVALSACFCVYLVTAVPKLETYTQRWEKGKDTYRYMDEILDTIPQDASVNCSTFLLAHMADRDVIYEVNYHGNKPDVDFVVLDARYSSARTAHRAYLLQGYTEYASYDGLIVILQSPARAAAEANGGT